MVTTSRRFHYYYSLKREMAVYSSDCFLQYFLISISYALQSFSLSSESSINCRRRPSLAPILNDGKNKFSTNEFSSVSTSFSNLFVSCATKIVFSAVIVIFAVFTFSKTDLYCSRIPLASNSFCIGPSFQSKTSNSTFAQ